MAEQEGRILIIDRAAYDAMIQHMREAVPREGCGLLAGPLNRPSCPRDTNGDGDCGQRLCPECGAGGGRVDRWVPQANVSDFPRLRYEVDPGRTIADWTALDADDRRPWIFCHSHTRTSAAPSPLDIRYAVDPTMLHMIVSLAGREPVAALWRLDPIRREHEAVERVRYQVVDLGFQAKPAEDLTRHVTGPTV